MTSEEIKTNQRIFEVGGSIICGFIFGLLLWLAEMSFEERFNLTGYINLAWDVFISISGYLSICYLIDRYYERKSLRLRVNWILISPVATTLLFVVALLPKMIENHRRSPYRHDDEIVSYVMVLILIDVFMVAVMGCVWFLGFLMRLVSKESGYAKVAP